MTNKGDDETSSDVNHDSLTESSKPRYRPLPLNKKKLHLINMPAGVWVESVQALA